MELPILAILLASFVLNVDSHPKNSDILPKDYYKRQILQPVPGYIPVYIKADEVPIVRTENKKHSPKVSPEKVTSLKEKHLNQSYEESATKKQDQKLGETKSESSVESKNQPTNLQENMHPREVLAKNEKQEENSHVKADDLKP